MSRYFPRPDAYLSTANRPRIAVSRHTLSGVPEWLRGLRILFASDFHLRARMDPGRLVDALAGCEADLILLGGDYADRQADALRLFDALRGLRAPLGVFAVRGNNDAETFPGKNELADALAGAGIRLITDESLALPYNGGTLRLGGIDEYRHHRPDYSRIFPEEPNAYRLLLSHYPVLPDAPYSQLPDLMLSGHTHGGQFNFLGLTPYAIGFERAGQKRALAPCHVSGLRRYGRVTVLVSKGIGASRIPLRVGVRPEIHQIILGAR